MSITVAEIKAMLPEANVYRLDPDCRYIVLADPRFVSGEAIAEMGDRFRKTGIRASIVVVIGVEEAVKLLELK